jgi:hypothetical protein
LDQVGAVLWVLELAGLDDFVVEAEILRNPDRERAMALQVAGLSAVTATARSPGSRLAMYARYALSTPL